MLVVETIAKIRPPHFIDGKSIKQICHELRVSRNPVRKVIRSRATDYTYDRTTQPRPQIDPWRSELDALLAENDRRPKRERLTLIRIYEELRNRGYGGHYDAVRRYARANTHPKRRDKTVWELFEEKRPSLVNYIETPGSGSSRGSTPTGRITR